MIRRSFFLSCAIGCSSWLCTVHAENQSARQNFDVSELHQVLHEAIVCHPGKREVDETIIFRSFGRLLSQFDPDKLYLLKPEFRVYLVDVQ